MLNNLELKSSKWFFIKLIYKNYFNIDILRLTFFIYIYRTYDFIFTNYFLLINTL